MKSCLLLRINGDGDVVRSLVLEAEHDVGARHSNLLDLNLALMAAAKCKCLHTIEVEDYDGSV